MNWVEIISTLGFPIACVVALGAFIFKIYKRSEEREDALMQEISETRAVNSKAIETLSRYAEELNVIKEDIKDIKEVIIQ